MPDLITVANDLKDMPDQWLAQQAQSPTVGVPPYLVLAEMERRQKLRSGASRAQQPASSVSQDLIRSLFARMPPTQGLIPQAAAPPGMAPVSQQQNNAGLGPGGFTAPGSMRTPSPPRMMAGGGHFRDDGEWVDDDDGNDSNSGDDGNSGDSSIVPLLAQATPPKPSQDTLQYTNRVLGGNANGVMQPPPQAQVQPAPAQPVQPTFDLSRLQQPPMPESLKVFQQKKQQAEEELAEFQRQHKPPEIPTTEALSQEIRTALGPAPDNTNFEKQLAALQTQAQGLMHPQLSDLLMRWGTNMMASKQHNFLAAMADATGASQQQLDAAAQQGRSLWQNALQLGIHLQDRTNAYNEKVAQYAIEEKRARIAAGTAAENAYRTDLMGRKREIDRLDEEIGKGTDHFQTLINQSPYGRAAQINAQRAAFRQPAFDGTNGTAEENYWFRYGKPMPAAEAKPPDREDEMYRSIIRQVAQANNIQLPADRLPTLSDIPLPLQGKVEQAYRQSQVKPMSPEAYGLRMAGQDMQQFAKGQQSYQFHTTALDREAKPIDDRAERISRLLDTINAGTPLADSLIAPELMTVAAGGAGSGVRITQAEIDSVLGGRHKWDQFVSDYKRWSLDPSQPFLFRPEYKQQMRSLVNAIQEKVQRKQQLINQARQNMYSTNDPMAHRQIYGDLRTALSQIDNPITVRDPKGGVHFFYSQADADQFKQRAGIR